MSDLSGTPLARAGPTARVFKRSSILPDIRNPRNSNLEKSLEILDASLKPSMNRMMFDDDVTMSVDVTRQCEFNHTANITRGMPFNMTMNASLMDENPGISETENLFQDFLTILSAGGSGVEALDCVAEFEQMIGDHVAVLRRIVNNIPGAKEKVDQTFSVFQHLVEEQHTWRLVGKMYTDRLIVSKKEPQDLPPPAPESEKQIIERFLATTPKIRQLLLVVDWLEKNTRDDLTYNLKPRMEWFSDATTCWENTLAALTRKQTGTNMISELDPDAPNRTGKQLHDLDQKDEKLLLKSLYELFRAGLQEEAQELCVRMGQPWRAATMEGWKPYHDPNYMAAASGLGEKLPTEGNKHRDVWKQVAWGLTQDSNLHLHERAIYAALCGNLKVLQDVCKSWHDYLWAGAKCAVDVMVETEIRDNMVRSYVPLPTDYWNTPQSLEKVLSELDGFVNKNNFTCIIQKHVILDDWPGLVKTMARWLDMDVDPHTLRLMAHLVLVFRSLGKDGHEDSEERIVEAYCQYLMTQERLDLIPWYLSNISANIHIPLFSKFLADIASREQQELCLHLGQEVGLDMRTITNSTVKNARADLGGDQERMVNSLGWLTHTSDQVSDLIHQVNAVVRRLLSSGCLELANKAMKQVSPDTLSMVSSMWGVSRDTLEEQEAETRESPNNSLNARNLREHIALREYLSAQESFSDWFDHFHKGQPRRPEQPQNPTFTENVAHEEKMKRYYIEMDRWREGQRIQSRDTEQKLMSVLKFPGGWLMDEDLSGSQLDASNLGENEEEQTDEDPERTRELDSLRSIIIPQTVLLLHTVLHNTGQYRCCIAMVDLIASKRYRLSDAYTKEQMRQLLAKIRESSLAAMEKGLDAFGFARNS